MQAKRDRLIKAVEKGNIEAVKTIFAEGVDDINFSFFCGWMYDSCSDGGCCQDNNFITLLMLASNYGREEVVKFLIDQGADVNAEATCYNTAMSFAAQHGHLGIIELLLDAGAYVNQDSFSYPLNAAAKQNNCDAVQFLKLQGATYNRYWLEEQSDEVKYALSQCSNFNISDDVEDLNDTVKEFLPPVIAKIVTGYSVFFNRAEIFEQIKEEIENGCDDEEQTYYLAKP
jgi:hypothetical protein